MGRKWQNLDGVRGIGRHPMTAQAPRYGIPMRAPQHQVPGMSRLKAKHLF
ncbi:hypothetical protein [Azospirillum endophyticum]